jgi:hypothetical protein
VGVGGRALRAQWDATCDRAITAIDATSTKGAFDVVTYLALQRRAVTSIKAAVDGRRFIPGPHLGTGILHDIPPELGEPEHAAVVEALDAVRTLWDAGLGAEDYDWSQGYPADWPSGVGDRLRAGWFYARK